MNLDNLYSSPTTKFFDHHKRFWLLLVVVIAVLVTLVIVRNNLSVVSLVAVPSLPGVLYTSMAPTSSPLGILSYNFTEAEPTFKEGIVYQGATVMQFLPTDTGKAFAVFSAVVPNEQSGERQSNILMVDEVNGSVDFLLPLDTSLTGLRHLNYSKINNLLTFTAVNLAPASSTLADTDESAEWGLYIIDITTKTVEKIADASSDGNWSPDGLSLVFMSKDGLRQYQVATKSINVGTIKNTTGSMKIEPNMNLAVAPDGQTVALTSPNDNLLGLFEVVTWQPFTIASTDARPSIKKPNTAFYWPTFSPDGKFIVAQVVDLDETLAQSQPRIEVFDLATNEVVRTIPLNEYDFNRAFIDSWSSQ
jgi:WD40 repeat protein